MLYPLHLGQKIYPLLLQKTDSSSTHETDNRRHPYI
jgi:hypothetical protein